MTYPTLKESLEALMLISFSVSWYWSITRMLRSGQAAGKSKGFVLLICCGYLLGISSKLIAWHATGVLSSLIWLYAWNFGVTALDLYLVCVLTAGATCAAVGTAMGEPEDESPVMTGIEGGGTLRC